MITDTEIKVKGFKVLAESLGNIEAERFVTLLLREPFDYTNWQENLFSDMSVRQLSNKAMEHRIQNKSQQDSGGNL